MSQAYTALLLDAAGTLLVPREPIAVTYARFAARYGGRLPVTDVAERFPAAMHAARGRREPRGDWRPFWAEVVARSTGVSDPALVEALYAWFAAAAAWRVRDHAEACLAAVRDAGAGTALVSNWDTRLRPLLVELGADAWFDVLTVSGELGIEKPDPAIFAWTCARLGVSAATAVHVGDSWSSDIAGAHAAGLHAWHLAPDDVPDLRAVHRRFLARFGPTPG